MKTKRYIVNPTVNIVSVDDDSTAIISSRKRFCIKGDKMSVAIQAILKHFNVPACFDDVMSSLSNKYSNASLTKLLGLMVDKEIVVDEQEASAITNMNPDLLGKVLFYTSGGKGLQETIKLLTPLNIGLIGTNQLVGNLLHEFESGSLIHNFHIAVTDSDIAIKPTNDYTQVSNYPLDIASAYIDNIVNASDIVIAAFNFHDNYLLEKINQACFEQGKKWLRVIVDGIIAEIGPLFIPDETCCYTCLQTRKSRNAVKDEYIFDNLLADKHHHESSCNKKSVFASFYPANNLAASITTAELMKHLTGMQCNINSQVISVNCQDFHMLTHYIFKDYQCPVCSKNGMVSL